MTLEGHRALTEGSDGRRGSEFGGAGAADAQFAALEARLGRGPVD
ncbi:MAG: hypothetical protein U0232_00650 [Thermomicrobiales bacterium]